MVDYTQDDLTKWINAKAMNLTSGVVQKRLLNSKRGVGSTNIGSLYFFKYDPKHKDKLLIYDRYPMAFPIKMYGDGFLGVNMHYLPMGQRKQFVKIINDYKESSDLARIDVNIELFNELERTGRIYSIIPEAVKRYLFTQVRSRFIQILPEEYEKAVQLRIDEWVIKG
jgi:hypothetical protein